MFLFIRLHILPLQLSRDIAEMFDQTCGVTTTCNSESDAFMYHLANIACFGLKFCSRCLFTLILLYHY